MTIELKYFLKILDQTFYVCQFFYLFVSLFVDYLILKESKSSWCPIGPTQSSKQSFFDQVRLKHSRKPGLIIFIKSCIKSLI